VKTTSDPPIISIVGLSGAGKTTVLEKLIPQLTRLGLKVGTIKHDVHGFEMDRPGKDSWRHKRAGAVTTVLSSPYQLGMVTDVDHDHSLEELAPLLSHVNIILTEGYMREPRAKLEVYRPEVGREPLARGDKNLIALVSSAPVELGVPCFSLDDMEGLAQFLAVRFKLVFDALREPGKAAL
jgi:molybdopterin-guanine dinucleotide biosynthesis protein B